MIGRHPHQESEVAAYHGGELRSGCFSRNGLARECVPFFAPARGCLADHHPTYCLLGFSAALAPKFHPSIRPTNFFFGFLVKNAFGRRGQLLQLHYSYIDFELLINKSVLRRGQLPQLHHFKCLLGVPK